MFTSKSIRYRGIKSRQFNLAKDPISEPAFEHLQTSHCSYNVTKSVIDSSEEYFNLVTRGWSAFASKDKTLSWFNRV